MPSRDISITDAEKETADGPSAPSTQPEQRIAMHELPQDVIEKGMKMIACPTVPGGTPGCKGYPHLPEGTPDIDAVRKNDAAFPFCNIPSRKSKEPIIPTVPALNSGIPGLTSSVQPGQFIDINAPPPPPEPPLTCDECHGEVRFLSTGEIVTPGTSSSETVNPQDAGPTNDIVPPPPLPFRLAGIMLRLQAAEGEASSKDTQNKETNNLSSSSSVSEETKPAAAKNVDADSGGLFGQAQAKSKPPRRRREPPAENNAEKSDDPRYFV